jgi:hypothetical protein
MDYIADKTDDYLDSQHFIGMHSPAKKHGWFVLIDSRIIRNFNP